MSKDNSPVRKVGIIGCGRIAGANDRPDNPHITTHARAIAGNPGYALVSCCDPDPAVAADFAQRWGCARHYSKAEDLIGSGEADVLVIAASTSAHKPILELALDSGHPSLIICEKPLVGSPSDWSGVAPRLAASTTPVILHYQRRFDAAHQALRERIRAGEWGSLLSFHAHVAKGLLHNGCHMIDLIQFLLGDLESLKGAALRPMPGDLAGTAIARLGPASIAGGVEGTVTGLEAPEYSLFELDLVFARGKVEIRKIGQEIALFVARPSAVYPGFNDLERQGNIPGTLGGAFAGLYAQAADPAFDAAFHRRQAWQGTDLLMGLLRDNLR